MSQVIVEEIDVFGGHMWTEAWMDGQWIPLDATLSRGGTGAAHLKMSGGSLADNAPTPFATRARAPEGGNPSAGFPGGCSPLAQHDF